MTATSCHTQGQAVSCTTEMPGFACIAFVSPQLERSMHHLLCCIEELPAELVPHARRCPIVPQEGLLQWGLHHLELAACSHQSIMCQSLCLPRQEP